MIEYDEYKQKLIALEPEISKLSAALDLEGAKSEAEKLEAQTGEDGFWNDVARSQEVQQRLKQLKNKIGRQEKLINEWKDLTALCEMAQEADDPDLLPELTHGYETLVQKLEETRLTTLLSGEYDGNSAILTLHAGAGGTEAQDWAQMLYRMYTRWAERHDFTCQTLDYEDGDEAGIKSAAIAIEGENAYGLLKSEHGVHRLVRISPFDANARRQTSFAAVEIMIRDCTVGDDTVVNASQTNESTIGSRTKVGPFAYVRPNSVIGDDIKVGDFVEVKNSVIGNGTKISHLTYVGDTDVGEQVNFGCGTVTTNYDGFHKYRTVIGNGVFIGCNTNLVAPVSVGDGAYIAAGATITKDVPADSLAIARSPETIKDGWAARRRQMNGKE